VLLHGIITVIVTVTVTGWYRTRLPKHCDHFWSILSSPSDLWSFLILPPELSSNHQKRHVAAEEEKLGQKWPWILPMKYLFHTRRVLYHVVKPYDMGPTSLLPIRMKACYGFLSPLKIHPPWPCLNSWTLGIIASMLTTRPPRAATGWFKNYVQEAQNSSMQLRAARWEPRVKIT
jgi:hypothetical protein